MIISIIFSLIYIVSFGILVYKDMKLFITLFLLCIIPFICSYIIFLIGKHTSLKYPKITKIIANIVNLLVLVTHFCCFVFIFIIIWSFLCLNTEYTDIKDYKNALNSYSFEAIEHFPNQIPQEARNISMRRSPSSFTGDSEFYLKFDISKDYIEQENKKYKNKGEEFFFKNDDFYTSKNYDYNEAGSILHSITNDSTKGWMIRILERNQCLYGIASKDNTIIYILYCD